MTKLRSLLAPAALLALTVIPLPVSQATALAYKDPTGDYAANASVAMPSRPPACIQVPNCPSSATA